MSLIKAHPYELVGLLWVFSCFSVLIVKVPRGLRRRTVKEIVAVTLLFAVIAAVVMITLDDAPRVLDWTSKQINKLAEKELGG